MSEKIPSPEEYAKRHKDAFRCAFDFLNSHFPPGDGPAWWDQTAKDMSAAGIRVGEERLACELLAGIAAYLDYECKLRRGNNGETEH